MMSKNIVEKVLYTNGGIKNKNEVKFEKRRLRDGRIMFSTNGYGFGFMCETAEPDTDKYKDLEERYERIKNLYTDIGFYKKEV